MRSSAKRVPQPGTHRRGVRADAMRSARAVPWRCDAGVPQAAVVAPARALY